MHLIHRIHHFHIVAIVHMVSVREGKTERQRMATNFHNRAMHSQEWQESYQLNRRTLSQRVCKCMNAVQLDKVYRLNMTGIRWVKSIKMTRKREHHFRRHFNYSFQLLTLQKNPWHVTQQTRESNRGDGGQIKKIQTHNKLVILKW